MTRGISDNGSLLEAYGIVRKAGIAGLVVQMTSLLALRMQEGRPPEDLVVVFMLSMGWTVAMVGLCFMIDARRGAIGVKGPPPWWAVHLVIVFSIVGAGLFVIGSASMAWVAMVVLRG